MCRPPRGLDTPLFEGLSDCFCEPPPDCPGTPFCLAALRADPLMVSVMSSSLSSLDVNVLATVRLPHRRCSPVFVLAAEDPADRAAPGGSARDRGLAGVFGSGPAQRGDLRLEVLERFVCLVDRGEPQVGDEVEVPQRPEYLQAHLVAGQLRQAPGPDGLLDTLGELGELVLADRPS